MTPAQFVDRDTALAEVMASMAGPSGAAAEIALDTEFMRERTFYPKLCLIQLASSAHVLCVDPLAIKDLSCIGAVLSRPDVRKIAHAARQDIEVLLTRCEQIPVNLFDTQVAAALLGYMPQIGYGELVERVLGVKLEKGHARTDWAARPLSTEQLHYAADDVRHLLPLRERLQEELEKLGRLSWLETDMRRLTDPALYRADPADAWQRLKGLESLDERRLAAMKALAQWREMRAMSRDRPRSWILEDEALREMATSLPADMQALSQMRTVPPGVIEKCGQDLLAAIGSTAHLATVPYRARRYHPDPQQQALVKKLGDVVRKVAERVGLSPEVLATRKDLQQLASGKQDIEPLRHWRREVIGEELLRQL